MGWTKVDPIARPIERRFDAAVLNAIDDTTTAAAIYAKQNHGWNNVTGTAEGSIRFDPAKKIGPSRFRGEFGSYDVNYFIFLELGHHFNSAGTRQFAAEAGGHTSYLLGDHTLRRAADAKFPTLGANLRRHL